MWGDDPRLRRGHWFCWGLRHPNCREVFLVYGLMILAYGEDIGFLEAFGVPTAGGCFFGMGVGAD